MGALQSLEHPVLSIGIAIAVVLVEFLQFAVPMCLLVRKQPPREDLTRRAAAAIMCMLLIDLAVNVMVYLGSSELQTLRYVINFMSYSLLMVSFVPAILHCLDTSVWNAALATTAGYTMQNLGTGLGELTRVVVEHAVGAPMSDAARFVVSSLGVVLVVGLCYRPFICRVDRIGRMGEESRSMLGMIGLVILVVIGYDVVIRGLDSSASFGFLVTLRLVHAAVSVFILYAEYEMLVNARLKSEIAMAAQLSAERERQYELSRETIAAVNRRVHDIRHQVLRELDAAEVDRETLAEVARDIDVYGAQVRTGHDALDTILTEKSLLCQREGITLSCIADGSALMWMSAVDLYALFGDVLDVALDEARAQADAELRTVSLTLRRVGAMAALHVECFSAEKTEGDVRLDQARALVERLGGSVVVASRGITRSVDVLLPASS
ncbi:MAG: hypothetical protein IJ092_14025 [Atopobiaceae bacterium]|nr:hypothetical protein [Atopobiaceae bacterium]